MDFLLQTALLVIGFIMLIKGADIFVDGSSALAIRLHVPGVIIGLTIVALGTSAPELAVSTSAAISGSNEIALSNVIGSNLFNLLGVLGACAIICIVPADKVIIKRDFPISVFAAVFVLLATSFGALFHDKGKLTINSNVGKVSRIIGIMCLLMFVFYIILLINDAKKHPSEDEQTEPPKMSRCILLIIVGLAMIVAGGQLVVSSAKKIAAYCGMSETLIGLTIVAIGTSLPELVTSVVAAKKQETGLAVGNVVGSNIFNMLFILGISSTIHPIAVNLASVYDLLILIAVSISIHILMIFKKCITRSAGILMLITYACTVVFAALR